MKTTLKVAELATFIYAILFFGSMCAQMSYFAPFGISVSSYMNASEIFLLFLEMPSMYMPIFLILILNLFYKRDVVSKGPRFLSRQRKALELDIYVDFIIYYFFLMFISILNRVFLDTYFIMFMIYLSITMLLAPSYTQVYLNRIFRRKAVNNPAKMSLITKYKAQANMIRMIINNKFIFNIVLGYTFVVLGLCFVNYSRAVSYIGGVNSPEKKAHIYTDHSTILCDNEEVIFVGESSGYVFVYDRMEDNSIVIPKTDVISIHFEVEPESLYFNINQRLKLK